MGLQSVGMFEAKHALHHRQNGMKFSLSPDIITLAAKHNCQIIAITQHGWMLGSKHTLPH